ncbi:TolC family outer membrane protein [Limnohabitans sp. Bal53]|uniref:TolC family outer membrane protein n=1 Tax=Limnohabitans sp. Bal53 TaxID=1977910 RepID=UPI000D38A50D|nr:TolC family outer membrane protein [Limnohabitans sp. Bal53]PUE42355.1 channel protein TolC [Limnohabitans sp. Bal53]
MKLRTLPLTLALMAAFAGTAQAQSLATLYEAAKSHDANFKSARAQHEATLAKAEQAKAFLRPTAGLGANLSETDLENQSTNRDSQFGTRSVTFSASQPLYRPANQVSYEQGMKQVALAQAQLKVAEQELIVRLSQAYFDVLTAQEGLNFVKAQKSAVSEQLAAAKRNFEVGTATITDTREAQARFDLVTAQEIAADNDLRIKKLALDDTVGKSNVTPKPLLSAVNMDGLQSGSIESWVAQSAQDNGNLAQARIAQEVAQLEITKAKAALRPTLDLTGSYGMTRYRNGATSQPNTNAATVGLAFNLPLYTGQATQNRIKEAVALQDKAQSDLEAAQRNVAQATRAAFLGVQSGLSQVKALQAAEASSQSALDANKLGYQVGVRINIDVLNSQSQLFQTKRDLAKARHDVLVGQLRLKQAAGVLKSEDLKEISLLLQK